MASFKPSLAFLLPPARHTLPPNTNNINKISRKATAARHYAVFRPRHGPHHLGHAKLVRLCEVHAVRGSRRFPLPTPQACRGFTCPLLDAPLSLRPTGGPPFGLGLERPSVSGCCGRHLRDGGGYGGWRCGVVADREHKGLLALKHGDRGRS